MPQLLTQAEALALTTDSVARDHGNSHRLPIDLRDRRHAIELLRGIDSHDVEAVVFEHIDHLIQRVETQTPAVAQGLSGGFDLVESADRKGSERDVARTALADQLLQLGATLQVESDLALDGLLSRLGERRPLPKGQNPYLGGWIRRQI